MSPDDFSDVITSLMSASPLRTAPRPQLHPNCENSLSTQLLDSVATKFNDLLSDNESLRKDLFDAKKTSASLSSRLFSFENGHGKQQLIIQDLQDQLSDMKQQLSDQESTTSSTLTSLENRHQLSLANKDKYIEEQSLKIQQLGLEKFNYLKKFQNFPRIILD
ncbi:hypothetical protein GEMRC1_012328 [Eukaryota sp. GEM-RC1]